LVPGEFDRVVVALLDSAEPGGEALAEIANRRIPAEKFVNLTGLEGGSRSTFPLEAVGVA
jgi:hypothetical protein